MEAFFVSIKVTLTNLCQRGLQGFFIHGHAYSFIMASVSSSLRCCCFVLCTDEPTELFTSFFLANGLTWFTMCHWPSFLSEWMCRCCSFGSSLTPCYWTCQTRPRSNSVAVVVWVLLSPNTNLRLPGTFVVQSKRKKMHSMICWAQNGSSVFPFWRRGL